MLLVTFSKYAETRAILPNYSFTLDLSLAPIFWLLSDTGAGQSFIFFQVQGLRFKILNLEPETLNFSNIN